ncbi:CBO0543 family protein [Sutcliffiella halmapala]|uniref:CBO0543 family protein n=1 Tax=Sutcliffiella halmapala TaxID=79882 RepID=UPI0009951619|nr:CBO0543 family protein [Sutcliffiella halmapala]
MKPISLTIFFDWILLSNIEDPRWWLLFISIFLPWIIWWKLADKKRLFELLTYGLLWGCLATWLDIFGTSNRLWEYPVKLYDKVITLFPADISVIPVLFTLLYQYAPKWKTFFIGSVIVSSLFSFVFEPLFIKLNMLNLITWSHIKSFIAFIFLALLTRGIIMLVKKLQKKFIVD